MKTNKVISGVIGGIAIGAILGILFAPSSGKKTRKKIADKSKALKDNAKGDFDKLIQKIDEKYQSVSENANKFLHEGKSKIENGVAKKN